MANGSTRSRNITIAALVAALAGGCIASNAVPCGDAMCPVGTVCLAGVSACATPDEVAACSALAEAAPCTTPTRSNGLFCVAGACVGECGDERIEGNEVCDDGNIVDGDGCASNCESIEVCGDGILNPSKLEQCDRGVPGLSSDGCSSVCSLEFDTWLDISPPSMRAVSGAAMAYDPQRKVMVVFSGGASSITRNETWEWDGSIWRKRNPIASPPARFHGAMAYDQRHGVMVLFGGSVNQKFGMNDTWIYDGLTWTEQTFANPPKARFGHSMTAMANGDIIMFGGSDSDETWRYDGTWQLALGAGIRERPSARQFHSVARDGDTLLLYGGENDEASALYADTWRWVNNNNWEKVANSTEPGPLSRAVMVQTKADGSPLLVGGKILGPMRQLSTSSDAWIFNGTKWELAARPPLARAEAAMAFDNSRNQAVLVGGLLPSGSNSEGTPTAQTDVFASNNWELRTPAAAPSPRQQAGVVFDQRQGRIVLFGGLAFNSIGGITSVRVSNETWTFDGSAWQLLPVVAPWPTARRSMAMAYDTVLGRSLMFGGFGAVTNGTSGALNDLWSWNGQVWQQLLPPSANDPMPAPRQGASVTYDSRRQRLVLFGGSDGLVRFNDTWEFDGVRWIDRTPTTTDSAVYPPGRSRHAAAYDAARGVTVLVGGDSTMLGVNFADVWEWDGTSWQPRQFVVTPGALLDVTLSYDSLAQTMLLFANGLMWSYDGIAWRKRPTIAGPAARARAASAYDSLHHQVVQFGGVTEGNTVVNDTWRFSTQAPLDGPDECRQANVDSDRDGLVGCADPDCWGRCKPLCTPGQACASTLPQCGDGTCNADLEDKLLCPADCPPP